MKIKVGRLFLNIDTGIKIGDPYCKGIVPSLFQDIERQCDKEICELSDKPQKPECKFTIDQANFDFNCVEDVNTNCRISIDSLAKAYENAANAKEPECYSEDPMYKATQQASLKCAQGK